MALWKAECYLGSNVGTVELTVPAASASGARQILQRTYGAKQIYNLREINSNGSSTSDTSGAIGLAVIVGIVWVFLNFAPWILMFLFGGISTWLSELILGTSLEEATQNDETPKIAFILILSLLAGGFGFYKGNEIKQHYLKPKQDQPTQVKTQPKSTEKNQMTFIQ